MSASCAPSSASECMLTVRPTTSAYCSTRRKPVCRGRGSTDCVRNIPLPAGRTRLQAATSLRYGARRTQGTASSGCKRHSSPHLLHSSRQSVKRIIGFHAHRVAGGVEVDEVRLRRQLAVVCHLALDQVPHPQFPVPARNRAMVVHCQLLQGCQETAPSSCSGAARECDCAACSGRLWRLSAWLPERYVRSQCPPADAEGDIADGVHRDAVDLALVPQHRLETVPAARLPDTYRQSQPDFAYKDSTLNAPP